MFRIKHLQDYRWSDLTFCFQFYFYCVSLFSVCPLIRSFLSLNYNGADRIQLSFWLDFTSVSPTKDTGEGWGVSRVISTLQPLHLRSSLQKWLCFLFFWLQCPQGCDDDHSATPDVELWQLRSCLQRRSEIAALYEHAGGTDYWPGHSLVPRWPHDS